jgi:type VI secretion system Hcp family effector
MKNSFPRLLCAAALVLACQRGAAQSAVLHIPGVAGESTVQHHAGDIDITGFTWSVSNPNVGQGSGSSPTFTDVSVTKLVDSSSPILASACANRTPYGSVTIYCTKFANSDTLDYYTIALGTCTVTGVSSSSQSIYGPITETITLHFTSIQWTYLPVNNGTTGTPIVTHYP